MDRVASVRQTMSIDLSKKQFGIVVFVQEKQFRGRGQNLLVDFDHVARRDDAQRIQHALVHKA